MPTVLNTEGFRFFFFSNEGTEPPHIHVQRAEKYAKFWLQPLQLSMNDGYTSRELSRIDALIEQHRESFLEAWREFFAR